MRKWCAVPISEKSTKQISSVWKIPIKHITLRVSSLMRPKYLAPYTIYDSIIAVRWWHFCCIYCNWLLLALDFEFIYLFFQFLCRHLWKTFRLESSIEYISCLSCSTFSSCSAYCSRKSTARLICRSILT